MSIYDSPEYKRADEARDRLASQAGLLKGAIDVTIKHLCRKHITREWIAEYLRDALARSEDAK